MVKTMNKKKGSSKFFKGPSPWKDPAAWFEEEKKKLEEQAAQQGLTLEGYENDEVPVSTTQPPLSGGGDGGIGIFDKPIDYDKPPPRYLEEYAPKEPPKEVNVPDAWEPPLAEDQINPPKPKPPIDSPPSDDFSPAPLNKDVKKTEKDTSPSTGDSWEISWYYWGIPLAVIVIGGAIFFMSSSSPAPQPIPTVNLRASQYFTPSAADVVQYAADA